MRQSSIHLRCIEDHDINLLNKWLHKDYISKWYHDTEEWIREVKERNEAFSFLSHFIVWDAAKPIGFCQYYDCFDAKEDWYSVNVPNVFYSIDYLIGEEIYLGKGYGKEIVKALIKKIQEEKHPKVILVQPELENIASCKSLIANNFAYNEDGKYYVLNL